MSFEESLIRNASPTLANLKVANLYNYRFNTPEECSRTIQHFNCILNPKGIYVELLKSTDDFYLIYVYRKSKLACELQNSEIQEFLSGMGYTQQSSLPNFLNILKNRIAQECGFPHEIGVFLGYPLDDVKSFIEKKGQHFVMSGDWKVYHNEQSARKTFLKFRHCKDIYIKVYSAGRNLSDMLVSA